MEREYDYLFKIVFVGDVCTGKSSLLMRAIDDVFPEAYKSTDAIDVKITTVDVDGKVVKLQICDTSGEERFMVITSVYYKSCHLIVLVFDTTNIESFENLRKWHENILKYADEGTKFLVVGNKTDLGNKREVSRDTAVSFAEEIGAGYFEASAKNKLKVDLILSITAQYCMKTRDPSEDRGLTLNLQNPIFTTTTTETTTPIIRKETTPITKKQEKQYDYLFKLVIVGETNTGKSSILKRYIDNAFSDVYIPTIGVDFKMKTLDVYGKKVKLQIWEASGQERFKSITTNYYTGAPGFLLVYDITSKKSFEKLQSHISEVKTRALKNMKCMVVGNKTDLESKREVSYDEGRAFAESIEAGFWEVSAKNDDNLHELFVRMACDIINAISAQE